MRMNLLFDLIKRQFYNEFHCRKIFNVCLIECERKEKKNTMSKNIIEKKKKNVMSLAQFYNFIVSHQSPTRVQNKIPAPVHQLTKLTTLVRGVIDLFSETNFLSRPDKY